MPDTTEPPGGLFASRQALPAWPDVHFSNETVAAFPTHWYNKNREVSGMGLALVQKQSLKLKMAPALYQSVTLLQFNNEELSQYIHEKALENPLLHVEDSDFRTDRPYTAGDGVKSTTEVIEETVAGTSDFRELLHRDLHQLRLNKKVMAAADVLIDCLNDNGYLDEDPENLLGRFGLDSAAIEKALAQVQSLEPAGVGARSLAECLLLQLKKKAPRLPLAELILSDYCDRFLTGDWAELADMLGTTEKAVLDAVAAIRSLSPVPVSAIQADRPHYVVPDVTIGVHDGRIVCELEDRFLPKVSVDRQDYEQYLKTSDSETKRYLHEKIEEATWLLAGVSKRKQTIMMLAEMMAERQKRYFMTGEKEHLQPFTMKTAAERLSVHESTVSRAVANKYVQTPYGLFPLKNFFVRGIKTDRGGASVFHIQSRIRYLIERENRRNPLSDQRLAGLLAEEGLRCSRRAVTKYRRACGIGSTVERRLSK